mmetsp:Transcript_34182/g.74062  ORF Transcript_34182/g.74062 Transcript_34182/m.74062 type:complete len:334 (-) Transcript_34182:350-1351(-)
MNIKKGIMSFEAKKVPSDGDVVHSVLFVDALHDACDDLPRAQLVAALEAVVEEPAERGLPLHWRGDLHGEDGFDDLWVAVSLGVDVGVHRDPRRGNFRLREDLRELRHGAVHVGGVEGAGDGEPDGHPRLELRLGLLLQNLDGLDAPGHGVVAVAKKVGDLDRLALPGLRRRGRAQLRHLVRLEADHAAHGRRPRVRRSLHRLPPGLDDLQSVLKADGAGKAQGRVLSQAQPRGDVARVDDLLASLLLAQLLDRRHGRHEDGRLRHRRRVELICRAVDANVEEVVPQHLGRFAEEGLGGGDLLADARAHAYALRALSGEEKSDRGLHLREAAV